MKQFETLSDLLSLPGFRSDLQGPRKRGSLTEKGLDNLDPMTPVDEFSPTVGNVPTARYFVFDAAGLNGRLGAAPLASLSEEQQKLLRCRHAGDHGIEMFLDVDPSAADLPLAPEGVAILGPIDEKGTLGWWTWYVASGGASRVMGCLLANGRATDHPAALLAVKLHNGS